MVSKALTGKIFAAVTTTSAAGTGIAKIVTSQKTRRVVFQEEKALLEKFRGKSFEEVFAVTGFEITKNKEEIKKIIEKRFKQFKTEEKDQASEKFSKFCTEGLEKLFSGLNELYKALAAICAKEITISSKVEKSGLTSIPTDNNGSQDPAWDTKWAKVMENKENKKTREFLKDLYGEGKTKNELIKKCKGFAEKDIFEVESTILSDYMRYCIKEEKSLVVSFWTGSKPKQN